MKKHLLKTILLLFALVAGSTSVWAADETWTHTFVSPEAISDNSITVDNATWTVTTTKGQGSPTMTAGNTYSKYGLKFGSSKSVYYGSVTFSTDYFNSYNVKSVTINVFNNGKKTGTLTAKQGNVNIGSASQEFGTSWTDLTAHGSTGAGGALSFTYSVEQAFYIHSITVTYTTAAPTTCATPTISIPADAFVSTKNVTIDCATAGASIYYTTNGDTPTTSSTAYTDPFEISATTTVKAIAVKDGLDNSAVASQTFTKETVIDGVAALNAADDGTHYVNLTNAQITYVSGSVGYLNDANAGILFYKSGLTVKTVYNGIFKAVKTVYNAMPEITSLTAVEGTTNVAAEVADPVVLTASELQTNFSNYLARQVKINRYEPVSSTKFTDDIDFYTNYQSFTWEADKEYTFIGYPYNNSGTKQFRIVSVEEYLGEPNEITGINDEYRIDLAAEGGIYELVLSGVTATSGATVQFEVTATNIDAADYTLSGKDLLVKANGYITVRAYVNKDATYRAAEKTFTVYLLKQPTIVVNATEDITFGSTFTVDNNYIEGGAITVTSANPNVATVDGLVITPKAAGSVDITVSTAADNVYVAGSESFTLNINQPAGKETAAPAVKEIFSESWSSTAGTGGNDDSWSGSIASGDIVADNIGWTYGNGYGAKDCVRLGKSSSGMGTATTPKLGTAGTLKLTFRAAAWDASKEATEDALELSTVGGGTITPAKVSLAKGAWGSYEATITNATADTQIKFSGKNTGNNRFFLDDVVVTSDADITATLNASGYATYCSEYPLDFSEAADYTAWQITEVDIDGKITFSKVIETKGGTGLLLKGKAEATITLKSSNSSTTLSDNILVGTLAPTYVEAGTAYGLSGNKFVVNNAPGNISAGKAYIEALSIPTGVKHFTLVFEDETTGITETRTATREEVEAIFNLAGQRMSRMHKGVNIVNGKKILVK